METISGGSGNDTLIGTAGDDTVTGGGGADSIVTGTGNDSILGNDGLNSPDGADTIDAGAGNDTVQADGGNDVVFGGDGLDSLHGDDGDDWIDGGGDADILYGDAGNDTVLGGSGDDLIYGGDGNDRIDGGAGTDTLYGGTGADTFVVTAGSGTNLIEDFSAGDGDLIAINYPGITSFAELQPYLSDDGNWGTLISLPDGSVTQVKWLDYPTLSATSFTFESGPVCFLRGTLIETATGPRPVQTLAPGDLLLTHDHGLQPLLFLSSSTYRFGAGPHKMKPIRLRPNVLGQGSPSRDLLVSPQHRIALPQRNPEVLVAARKLTQLPGVSERSGCLVARYYHLLLRSHELLCANGVWAESLLVTDYSSRVARLPQAYRFADMTPARPLGIRHLGRGRSGRAALGPMTGRAADHTPA